MIMDRHVVSEAGFTLVELAVVLVIMAVLIGGMLVPLSAQRDIRNVSETQKQLSEIREALLGFAIINNRLPCPTTTTDPSDPNYGIEDAACNNVEGYLPWKSLGVSEIDAWGSKRTSTADPFPGYWRYRVDNAFALAFTLPTPPSSALVIQDASGNGLTQAPPNGPVAIIYSTGPDNLQSGANAVLDTTYQAGERTAGFDDLVVWLSRPILLNRMISANKLP